jgi:hypothetical protein
VQTFSPAARSLFPRSNVAGLADALQEQKTLLETDSFLTFVCGAGPQTDGRLTRREMFLKHADIYWDDLYFFRAEEALRAFTRDPTSQDLLSFESELAKFADCILMILESPGVLAELGAFAHDQELVQILLAVNDIAWRNQQSFIEEGPLRKIALKSRFGEPIYVALENLMTSAPEIERRLRKIAPKRRKKVLLATVEMFSSASEKERMFLVLDLISIFCPITHGELVNLLQFLIGNGDFRIHLELSMLMALGLAKKQNDYYIRSGRQPGLFLRFGELRFTALRARTVAHYHKYYFDRIQIMGSYLEATR